MHLSMWRLLCEAHCEYSSLLNGSATISSEHRLALMTRHRCTNVDLMARHVKNNTSLMNVNGIGCLRYSMKMQ